MLNRQQKFGRKGESMAARYLEQHGYTILKQNYRTKLGEIDIIAKEKGVIVFVEVKSRRSGRFGNAKWAVTSRKQKKISMVALYYLKAAKLSNAKARFDVVAISSASDRPRIEIIRNAFDLAYK